MRIKPKKSLGQNFLADKNIQRKIILTCGLNRGDIILEIGAGRGELTLLIAQDARQVYALEIDWRLADILKDNLRDYSSVKIICQDILKFDLNSLFLEKEFDCRLKVIGNIPYYITTPIIEYLLRYRDKIDVIFLTVQKELAERITAVYGSKRYSAFSCFLQYYTLPETLFTIKNNCFRPVPKVDSCFLKLKIREKPAVEVKNEVLLFTIIRAAFNQRRKILRNSLEGIIPQDKLEKFFTEFKISSNIRPEQLRLQDFAGLADILSRDRACPCP
ncbi:MAG: 16S rRNA (adenine(1518)-N(6)/adenine(1519)-N(6))-dimethyltransferase RsmA [Candidatus Omnitrophota bacterium]